MKQLSCYNPTPEFALKFLGWVIKSAPIRPAPLSERKSCIFNVQDAIKNSGGTAIYVRQIIQYDEVFLQIRPHVIWKTAEGEIIDITPDVFGLSGSKISYYESDTEFGVPLPPTRNVPITSDPDIRRLLAIENIAYEIIHEFSDETAITYFRLVDLKYVIRKKVQRLSNPCLKDESDVKCFLEEKLGVNLN